MFDFMYRFFSCNKSLDTVNHDELRIKYMRAKKLPFTWKTQIQYIHP